MRPTLICYVSTYRVLENGLLRGHQLCKHRLCASTLGCCVKTYCVSGIELLCGQMVCAKLYQGANAVSGQMLLCGHSFLV